MDRKKGAMSRWIFIVGEILGRIKNTLRGRKRSRGSGEIDPVKLLMALRKQKKQ